MASLRSIPETPTSATLHTNIAKPRRPHASIFERGRPRSRVLVISKSSKVKRQPGRAIVASTTTTTEKTKTTTTPQLSSQDLIKDSQAKEEAQNTPTCHTKHKPSMLSVSTIESGSQVSPPRSVSDRSDASVDLGTFPRPPLQNYTTGWPLSDQEPCSVISGRAKTAILTRAKSPVKLVSHSGKKFSAFKETETSRAKGHYDHRSGVGGEDVSSSSRDSPVDSVLVEAISKSVAEQLRLFRAVSRQSSPRKTRKDTSDQHCNQSRTPSQRRALDKFTKELQRYAKNVNARGREAVFTSTPSKTPETLHTVSALLPYRSEFRAAGLAVTSNDQAQQSPKKATPGLVGKSRKSPQRLPPSQFDGVEGVEGVEGQEESTCEPSTEVDFAGSHIDEWRRALIDEVPPRGRPPPPPGRPRDHPHWRCFHCLPKKQSRISEIKESCEERSAEMSYVATGVPDSIETAMVPPKGGQYTLFPKQLPTEFGAIPDTEKPPERLTSTASAPALTQKPTGLRQRSMTTGLVGTDTKQPRTRSRPKCRQNSPYPGEHHQAAKMKPAISPLDLLPEHLSRLELHRFASRQYQSLPMSRVNSRSRQSQPDSKSAPEPAGTNKTANNKPMPGEKGLNPLKQLLHSASKVNSKQKAEMAAREIARHSLGPYRRLIKSRRISALSTLPPPRIPSRRSSVKQMRRQSRAKEFHAISDRDVLKGLHIAAAAACDEEIDGFVHDKTGVHIRQFLADLIAFESLSLAQPGEDAEERTRRRRQQLRKLKQQVRLSRELNQQVRLSREPNQAAKDEASLGYKSLWP